MNAFALRALARAVALFGSVAQLGAIALEAAPQDEPQRIVVAAQLNDPEQKPYQDLMKAVSMFEAYRQRSPELQLRFRLYARQEGVDLANSLVYVFDAETGERWPIPLADDGSFTLPDIPLEKRDAAMVRTNRRAGQLAWSVRVVRAKGDSRHRLLGDIRMECRLDLDGARLMRGIMTPAVLAMRAMGDLCTNKALVWVDYGEEPLFSVHIKYQGREIGLLSDDLYGGATPMIFFPLLDWPYLLRDRTYRVPLWDTSWPDEAEVQLVYVNDPPQLQQASQK